MNLIGNIFVMIYENLCLLIWLINVVFTPSYYFIVVCVLISQSRSTVCDSKDCNPPGASLHGILQARILEWVAILFSRDIPDPGIKLKSLTLQASFLPSELLGKPIPHTWALLYFLKCTGGEGEGGELAPRPTS